MYLIHNCPICHKDYERDCTPEPSLPCNDCLTKLIIETIEQSKEMDMSKAETINFLVEDESMLGVSREIIENLVEKNWSK